MPDPRVDFYAWFIAQPTEAEVNARQATKLPARRAAMIADWRASHHDATCSDAIAILLATLEESFGHGVCG